MSETKVFWPEPRDEAWFNAFVFAVGGPSANVTIPIVPEGVKDFVRRYCRLSPAPERGAAWTKEMPTKPGWYWVRAADFGNIRLVVNEIVRVHEELGPLYIVGFGWGRRVEDMPDAEWSGPIPEPTTEKPFRRCGCGRVAVTEVDGVPRCAGYPRDGDDDEQGEKTHATRVD